jgi:hypothetical protein
LALPKEARMPRRGQRVPSAYARLRAHLPKTQAHPAKGYFYKPAQSWVRLAEDLEQSQAFFAALDGEVSSDELEGHLRT